MLVDFFHTKNNQVISKSLDGTAYREKIISNNISNVNTPNYKRQLVNFEDELKKAVGKDTNTIPLYITKSNHINKAYQSIGEINPLIIEDKSTSLRTDNNNVDIDLEMVALSENTLKFNVLAQSLTKNINMLRAAIKGGR